jgi:hypothetical protein
MKITAILDEQELNDVDEFLTTIFGDDDEINGLLPFMIKPFRDIADNIIGADIWINDDCVEFLVGHDHDCGMGSEDGCDYCRMLYLLNILPE